MKLLLVCRAFDNVAGGVERIATVLMNEMCRRGHEVSLLTWDRSEAEAFYKFDERITWHALDMGDYLQKAGWGLRFKRARRVRRLVKTLKPDVILAFQHGTFLSTRLFTFGMGIPTIASERNAPSRFDHLKAGRYRNLIFQSFRLATRITIQCESYRSEYPAYLQSRIVTIPNPVFPAQSHASPQGEPGQQKTLLSIGRLSYQKNYFVLLQAFAALYKDFPQWRLVIAGEGEDRPRLDAKIVEHELTDQVSLPGAIEDVGSLYRESHLLCLPSRWEGFPNVLAEALSHGLPVVGFEGCAGVRDLIQQGDNGLLAEGNGNVESLARCLRTLMEDDAMRARMGEAGIRSVEPYNPQHIFDMWESFFKEVVRS
jgi:glycosyltransferase involved in cell wall biosynthesis